MNILIAYATNSGNTYYVAERIAASLAKRGHAAVAISVGDINPATLSGYEVVVLGSCTWEKRKSAGEREEGSLQAQMEAFIAKVNGSDLAGRKCAVFGLGDSEYTYYCRAVDFLEEFVKNAGGTLVVESLRVDSYPQAHDAEIDAWADKLGRAIG